MDAFEAGVVDAWRTQVGATSVEKLNLPLLRFAPDATADLPLLAVNFDAGLVAALRETRYFSMLGVPVPEAAAAVYARADAYRAQIAVLDLVADTYNRVQATLLPVERPLVEARLQAVEAVLKR
jgi:hypothetical protein